MISLCTSQLYVMNLVHILLLLLAAGSHVSLGNDGQTCDTSKHPELPTTRLRKELFCNYDRLVRPAKNHSVPTNVTFHLYLQSIDVLESSHAHVADIYAQGVWKWKDMYLKWNRSQHDNIPYLYTDSSNLWVPNVVLENSPKFQSITDMLLRGRCVLHFEGQVACLVYGTFRATCEADNTDWPFDTHVCSFDLTSDNDGANNYINLYVQRLGYSTGGYQPNREWQLLEVSAKQTTYRYTEGFTDTILRFVFTMRRHSALYAATILASALVLGVMTAVSFWIDASSPARLILCCMNVFVQCLFLQHLQYTVGSNGDSCPRIVLFYRDSLMLAAVSLLAAVLALRLANSRDTPPVWSSGAVRWLLEYRVAQVLLEGDLSTKVSSAQKPDEEAANVVDNSEDISEKNDSADKWIFLVNILDRILFYMFVIVYFILIVVRIT